MRSAHSTKIILKYERRKRTFQLSFKASLILVLNQARMISFLFRANKSFTFYQNETLKESSRLVSLLNTEPKILNY